MRIGDVADDDVRDVETEQRQLAADALAVVVVAGHAHVLAAQPHCGDGREHGRGLTATRDQVAADAHLGERPLQLRRGRDAVDEIHRVGADCQDIAFPHSYLSDGIGSIREGPTGHQPFDVSVGGAHSRLV